MTTGSPRTAASMRPVTYWWTWMPDASVVAISCSTEDTVRIRLGGQQAQGYHDRRPAARSGGTAGRRWSGFM